MFENKHLFCMTLLVSAVLCSACQPQQEDAKPVAPQQTAASEAVVEVLSLEGKMQPLDLALEDCSGHSCPDLSIDRLQTNQPFIDAWLDQEILKHLDAILQVSDADLKSKAAEVTSLPSKEHAASEVEVLPSAEQHLVQQAQPYVQSFLNLDKELKTMGVNHQINLSLSPKILSSGPPLATVVLNTSSYLGGAHGASSQDYYNFDLKSKKLVALADLLLPQQQTQLNNLAYAAFKTWVKDAKLAEDVQQYEQVWKFSLTQNYYLGQQGLILQYQEYEIAPYVAGLPRLTIPYAQLQGVLKPEYLPAGSKAASAVVVQSAQGKD